MLYIIPTPIWNKQDITLRALDLFKKLGYLICEDTRTTMKLLQMYDISYQDKEFFSLTSFTTTNKLNHYLNILKSSDVWLVSEAGTPWLSDPGKTLIQICNQNNITYTILPWANALIPCVVWSGFDTSKFLFLGFLPSKKWKQTLLNNIKDKKWWDIPVFFYESVHRIQKTIQELKDIWFDGKISISREISKLYEQQITEDIDIVLQKIKDNKIAIKWEFVVGVSAK